MRNSPVDVHPIAGALPRSPLVPCDAGTLETGNLVGFSTPS